MNRYKVHIFFVLMLGLIAAAPFFPDARTWGIDTWQFVPIPTAIILAFLAAAGLLIATIATKRRSNANVSTSNTPSADRNFFYVVIATLTIAGTAFFLFSSRTHFLGDGYEVLINAASSDAPLKLRNLGESYLHRLAFSAIGEGFDERDRMSFVITSGAAGILLVLIAAIMAYASFNRMLQRVLFLFGVLSGGYMLLYFGYVENYSIFSISVLLFGSIGMQAVSGKISKWWLLPVLLFASLLHVLGLVLSLPAAYVLLRDSTLIQQSRKWKFSAKLVVAVIGVLAFVILYQYITSSFLFVRFALLPLVADRFTVDGYTTFSPDHLLDFINLLVLLVPGFVLLLAVIIDRLWDEIRSDAAIQFLFVMTMSCLFTIFFLDPKLGMPRDWDLFAFAGVPLSLFLYYTVIRSISTNRHHVPAIGLSILLGLLTLVPRVYCQVVPEAGLAQVMSYFELDSKKSMQYIKIAQDYCLEHGHAEQYQKLGEFFEVSYPEKKLNLRGQELLDNRRYSEAIPFFDRAAEINPRLVGAFFNKALCFIHTGRFREAIELLEICDGLNPHNSRMLGHLALAQLRSNLVKDARKNAERAHELDPDDLLPVSLLIQIYKAGGESSNYEAVLASGARNRDAPVQLLIEATMMYIKKGNANLARDALQRAIAKGLDSATAAQLAERIR